MQKSSLIFVDEFLLEFFEFFDDPSIFQFTVRKHGRSGETLLSYIHGFSGNLKADIIPEGMVEDVGRLREFSIVDTECGTSYNRGSVKIRN